MTIARLPAQLALDRRGVGSDNSSRCVCTLRQRGVSDLLSICKVLLVAVPTSHLRIFQEWTFAVTLHSFFYLYFCCPFSPSLTLRFFVYACDDERSANARRVQAENVLLPCRSLAGCPQDTTCAAQCEKRFFPDFLFFGATC